MVHICFLGRTPCFVAGFEGVFCADYFSLEEGSQGRMIFREA